MRKSMFFVAVAAVALVAMPLAGHAALNSSFVAMSQTGEHQFYVWCTDRDDYVDSAAGANATDAQQKVAGSAGDKCWPVWQGLKISR